MAPLQRILPKAALSDEIPSTIEVMRQQEQLPHYRCRDYISPQEGPIAVNVSTRREMLEWVFKVTSFLKLSDEIAVISATLLDRFLQTQDGEEVLYSVQEYRLMSMASLYLSAKVFEHIFFISSEVMSAFSHGIYSREDVENAEFRILKALNWRTNPPTSIAFCQEFLKLLPCSVSQKMRDEAYDLCKSQIKRCILDYDFITTEASTIAFFSVQNALRSLGMDSIVLGHVASIFSYATHKDYYLDSEAKVQGCLNLAIVSSTVVSQVILKNHPRNDPRKKTRGRSNSLHASPSSVFER